MLHRSLVAACAVAIVGFSSVDAEAQAPQRTWNFLTTGNGHGFQVFDSNQNKIVTFLEHPYRYLRAGADPKSDGIGRRNLAFDFYFGLKAGGGAGWLNAPSSAGDPSYVDQSNILLAPASLAGVNAESYFFAPFGLEANVVVALLHAPGASDGYVIFNFHMGGGSPDTPDANGESLGAGASQSVRETGPGGGAMVYVPLAGADHEDCNGGYGNGQA